jgi:hypothetical protein
MRRLSGDGPVAASSDNEPGTPDASRRSPVRPNRPNLPANGGLKTPGDAKAGPGLKPNAGSGGSSDDSSLPSARNLDGQGALDNAPSSPGPDGSSGPRSLADLMQPRQKHPLPTEEQKREARQKLRQEVGEDLTPASSIEERRARLARLTKLADELASEPNVLYVVLQEAYLEAGNLRLYDETSKIVDRLAENFQVDEIAVRSKMIQDFAQVVRAPAERMAVASAAMTLAEQAYGQQKFDVAAEVAASAEGLAAKAGNAVARMQARQRAIEYGRVARLKDGYDKALAILAANPDDPVANTTVGRYRVLMLGDYPGGLPHLTKGDDARFKEIAERDLAGALSSQDRLALADAWFDLAKSDSELTPLYARARYWYRLAQQDASALVQVNIRRRLDEIAEKEAAGDFVDRTKTPLEASAEATPPPAGKKKKRR